MSGLKKSLKFYRAFSLTWPVSIQMYGNKTNCLRKKRVQLAQDLFGTPTWPLFHCFGIPKWPPSRFVFLIFQSLNDDSLV